MLVSIGTYEICDGTLEGGVAISDLRALLSRIFDVVIPIVGGSGSGLSPVAYDREITRSEFTFTVKRVHADLAASDAFILTLESTLPRRGEVKFIGFDGTTLTISDGCLVSHELTQQIGATTFHTYHIIGAGIVTPPSPPPSGDAFYVSFRIRPNDADDGGSYISIVGDDPDTDAVVIDGLAAGGGQFNFYGFGDGTGETDFGGWALDTYSTLEMKFTPAEGGGWDVLPRVNGTPGASFYGLTGSSITAVRFGGLFAGSLIDRNMDDLTIGTTDWGSLDLFSADFTSAIVPPFDSVVGAGCSIDSGTLLVSTSSFTDSYAIKALSFP